MIRSSLFENAKKLCTEEENREVRTDGIFSSVLLYETDCRQHLWHSCTVVCNSQQHGQIADSSRIFPFSVLQQKDRDDTYGTRQVLGGSQRG